MRILSKRQILMLHSALINESGDSDGIRDKRLLVKTFLQINARNTVSLVYEIPVANPPKTNYT